MASRIARVSFVSSHGLCLALMVQAAACVETERVAIDVKVDRSACKEASRVELFVLRLQGGGLCELARGGGAPPGAISLPALQLREEQIVLLGLAYGEPTGCGDEGCLDGRPQGCGDSKCDADAKEDCQTCPADCGPCGPQGCGDGYCDPSIGEDCKTCPKDCGSCLTLADTGAKEGGPGTCVRCYALRRATLGSPMAPITLELAELSSKLCAIPSSAAQSVGLSATTLPPARCK